MPTFRLDLPVRPSEAEIAALRAELEPYGEVVELPPVSFGLREVILGISFLSDVLQGADVLANWLGRTPRANKAVIRFSDGRVIRYQDTDPEVFRKTLRAALKQR